MIASKNLQHSWGTGRVLTFGDLHVSAGERWVLLGESGSGKTTLLHLIGGLLPVRQGQMLVNGVDISTLSPSSLDQFRGKNIGFIFQKNHLFQSLPVLQNLLMAPWMAGAEQRIGHAMELLAELGLADKAHARISQLSHGQAQRVAIARALMNNPALLLADEPTSALDNKNCDIVINLLASLAARHRATLVIATHDQRLKSSIPNTIQL